jgi:Uma2 family endonuclease
MLRVDVAAMDPGYDEVMPVPRAARLPIELHPPPGFDAADPRTWPDVIGRLEFVDGRLLYMPPCGEEQQVVTVQAAYVIRRWAEGHPRFDVGGNEAGMILGADVRGADVAVWPRPAPGHRTRSFRTTPPILAVEVAGRDDAEDEGALLSKATWYLGRGVKCVWLVLPETREVVVVSETGTQRFGERAVLPEPPELPGLEIRVDEIFSVL